MHMNARNTATDRIKIIQQNARKSNTCITLDAFCLIQIYDALQQRAHRFNLDFNAIVEQSLSKVLKSSSDSTVTRQSRRLQGLQPELSTVLAFPARKKMEREENRPFCHRWRDPTVFSGERGEDSQRWLSDFQRVARYNKWDDSMCLANVIFYLTGTAKCWFENFEEILNSWEEFKIKFCEIFGNKEDTARKAENILRTRAQTSGENVESYIQEVLLLCKQSNPRMSEGEKVSHLFKGVAEEVYQALVGKDISTVDQFVAFCRRFEAFKRMRVAPPRFNRLPNVTTISTAEPENLEALIRRIVREEVQKFMAPPSKFAAQDIDTLPPDLRDVIRSEIQQTLAPISAPRQPESFRPRRQYLPQNDQGYRRRTEGSPNNQRTQWQTEAKLLRMPDLEEKQSISEDQERKITPWANQEANYPKEDLETRRHIPTAEDSKPPEEPHNPLLAVPAAHQVAAVRKTRWCALWSADYSVISEAFRRSIKAPVFKENGPLLRAADKKPIVTHVAAECSHDVKLGWDFFRATDAIIDCGKNKLYLSEAEKSYEWKDLKLCAAMDCVLPPKSFGKIVVTNQDSQVIPSDMKVGTMQDLEVGSISNLDACSEIAGKDEVTSPDVRECLISMISTDLEETKKNRLLMCLNEFADIFDFEKKSFPASGEIKHKIDTSDYPPVRQRPYRVSPAERRVIQSEVEKMMETKIIRPSSSPWASPVILVRKKDGSLRFSVDYHRLNKITKKDVYPLPRIDDALDTLSRSSYFSTMDMRSGYWQIKVDDKDREKTAFITPDGLYEFNVMPFGLCNAPATFERMIDNVLRGLKWDMCLCYLDDIVVYGSTFKEHLTRLYKPDPEKVKAIIHFPKPRNISETRSFLGLSSYYRCFIKSYANKSRPLNSLLKKDEKFIWGEEQDESFRILKQELGSSPVLGHFVEGAETHVHTDASSYGLGAVLVQIQNDAERPIAYASRTLTKAEKNYSTTEKECLAVVWALGKFRPYLYGRPFTVVTDHHSLCWLVGLKDPSGRLARWALTLQEYNINIVYKSGRKHKDADCLSRSPLADTVEIEGHIISIQDVADEQSKDPRLVGIREKLANENLKGYQMIGGVLLKKNYDPEGKPWLLVVPKQMRHEILKDVHDTPMADHLGFAKTYDRVRKRFYWPGLYRTVSQYIAHFTTDYLTRFAKTKAATTAEATELATFLIEDVILKHGAPREIITDRGRNFMSQTVREINTLNGTIHRFTTAYHPQTNGLTERLSKTLTDMISMYVDVDQKNWDCILPYPAGTAEDYVGHLVTNAEDARMLARLNILQAQSKDKERYDKKHQEVTYKEGDLVWVFTPVRTIGLSEKLLKRYFGPYRVIRKISSVNYQVEGMTNTRRRRKTQDIVHVVRMKPYHDPEVQEQIAQDERDLLRAIKTQCLQEWKSNAAYDWPKELARPRGSPEMTLWKLTLFGNVPCILLGEEPKDGPCVFFFFNFLDVVAINSAVIYKAVRQDGGMARKDFIKQLALQLMRDALNMRNQAKNLSRDLQVSIQKHAGTYSLEKSVRIKIEKGVRTGKCSNLHIRRKAKDALISFNLTDIEINNYEIVVKKFEEHFIGKRNVIFERAQFNRRYQQDGEAVEEYIRVLHKMAENCSYGSLKEEMIRDRIVLGVKNLQLSEKLQLEPNLTLERAIQAACQTECVKQQQTILWSTTTRAANVDQVYEKIVTTKKRKIWISSFLQLVLIFFTINSMKPLL
ncbi:hypothetical protein LAZ67_22000949 [Cordylochernes scorpioides]|uniref:RNA-directed DNA polymerase n=1 Tax=Cordylochernes scorpioides TaxID=51811 RepID=A0ABY6LPM3_9ARAC|nr:hypothetical protein LAZ67_22000949 [Cordylochernes scorpioides]